MRYFGGSYWGGGYYGFPSLPLSATCGADTVTGVSFQAATGEFITLRPPDLGDRDSQSVNLKVRTMMDGSLRTHRSKKRVTKTLVFTDLSRAKVAELRDFYEDTAGTQLTYRDYAGNAFTGHMIDPEYKQMSTGRGKAVATPGVRAESFTVTITFEVLS